MTSVLTADGRSGVARTRRGEVAAIVGALVGLGWAGAVAPGRAVAVAGAMAALALAADVDGREHRLPNRLVALAAVPVLVAVVVGAPLGGPVAGALLVGGPLLLTHLAAPGGLGFGDVKAGSVLGAGSGLITPVLGVIGLLVGLVATASWALARRRRRVPLGPGMVAGVAVALAAGRVVGVAPW